MSFEQRVVQLEETNAELVKEVVRVRDAAAGLNRIYPSVSEGRQAVGDGQYFVVPGEGTYQTLYRRSGSSAEPIAEFPSRAHLEDVIDQISSLMDRGIEGGSGRILSVGAFGLGASAEIPYDNTLSTSERTARGALGRVESHTNDTPVDNGMFFEAAHNGSRSLQIVSSTSVAENSPVYVRVTNEGNNTGWRTLYHSGNLLNNVSRSGGVPTGGVIERGSNDDGEHVKFADGTMFCFVVARLDLTESGRQDFPLPALFSGDPFGGWGSRSVSESGDISALRSTFLERLRPHEVSFRCDGSGTSEHSHIHAILSGVWY